MSPVWGIKKRRLFGFVFNFCHALSILLCPWYNIAVFDFGFRAHKDFTGISKLFPQK